MSRRVEPSVTGQQVHLDWSSKGALAKVGELKPCVHCRQGALCRHPVSGLPCHKTCEELFLARKFAHGLDPQAGDNPGQVAA